MGSYQLSDVSSSATINNSIINFIGFAPSGHTDTNALAVCLYSYDYTARMWKPTTWS